MQYKCVCTQYIYILIQTEILSSILTGMQHTTVHMSENNSLKGATQAARDERAPTIRHKYTSTPIQTFKPTGSLGHVNISLFLSSTNSCYFMQTKISLFFSATNSCYFKQLLSATNSCCSTRRPRFRFSFLQLTGASSHTPRFHFSFLQLTATASHRHR